MSKLALIVMALLSGCADNLSEGALKALTEACTKQGGISHYENSGSVHFRCLAEKGTR